MKGPQSLQEVFSCPRHQRGRVAKSRSAPALKRRRIVLDELFVVGAIGRINGGAVCPAAPGPWQWQRRPSCHQAVRVAIVALRYSTCFARNRVRNASMWSTAGDSPETDMTRRTDGQRRRIAESASGLQNVIDSAEEVLESLKDQQGAAAERVRGRISAAFRNADGPAPESGDDGCRPARAADGSADVGACLYAIAAKSVAAFNVGQ
jgi:ElaB/YqjD/DUF883 family membrane-anchored ribosome-binding protein